MALPSVNTAFFLSGCPAVCALRGVQTLNLLTGMVAAEEQQVPCYSNDTWQRLKPEMLIGNLSTHYPKQRAALSITRHSTHQMQIKPVKQNPHWEWAACKGLVLSPAVPRPWGQHYPQWDTACQADTWKVMLPTPCYMENVGVYWALAQFPLSVGCVKLHTEISPKRDELSLLLSWEAVSIPPSSKSTISFLPLQRISFTLQYPTPPAALPVRMHRERISSSSCTQKQAPALPKKSWGFSVCFVVCFRFAFSPRRKSGGVSKIE